jgi:ribosomal protein S4
MDSSTDDRAEGMPPLELDDLFPGEKKPKVKVVGLKKKETFKQSRVAMHRAKKREARKENADYGKRIHKIQRVKPLLSRSEAENTTLVYSGLLFGALGAMALILLKNK